MAPLCASHRSVIARRRDVLEGRRHLDASLSRRRQERKSTVSHLSRKRAVGAAKTCLRKATRAHTRRPHTVTLDGYAASHRAVREFSEHQPGRPITIRSSKYFNKLIEQDHRAIKSRVGLMVGFKDFVSAQITLAGIELLHRIRQGQFALRKLGVAEKTAPEIWNAVLAA
jgi:transposase-like protein